MKELFLLDPDVHFLNHGSFGACPRPVFEAYQGFQRELELRPVEFLALERRFPELIDAARTRLAAYVGADTDNIAFTPNASTALNAAIRSLPLGPGDELLLGDQEYGGMEILCEFVARRTGATLVRRPFAELEPGPRTRAVFCSHVEWTSGRVNDLAPLIAAARDAGAVSIVDGAHAPGQIDLALDELGPDVYAGNCHKWLCAPKGAAFLHVRRDRQAQIHPLAVSHGRSSPRSDRSRTRGQSCSAWKSIAAGTARYADGSRVPCQRWSWWNALPSPQSHETTSGSIDACASGRA